MRLGRETSVITSSALPNASENPCDLLPKMGRHIFARAEKDFFFKPPSSSGPKGPLVCIGPNGPLKPQRTFSPLSPTEAFSLRGLEASKDYQPNGPLPPHSQAGPSTRIGPTTRQPEPSYIFAHQPGSLEASKDHQPNGPLPSHSQTGPSPRIGPATWQPEPSYTSAHQPGSPKPRPGYSKTRPDNSPSSATNQAQPAASPTTSPIAQTTLMAPLELSGNNNKKILGTTASLRFSIETPGEGINATVVSQASEGARPSQTGPSGPSVSLGSHLHALDEAYPLPVVCAYHSNGKQRGRP
ncbi:hypothetical protein CIPAW_09G005900 [Carya illinoinensis]|uniref:Uncharacterized protein n=1 Tax=Carya illinoinensis TaxID=32201 RepID=A0A8T1P8W8_CARIL|nr:hypothetical protein CIPAW_09G005900 [Carya illinoinensis]